MLSGISWIIICMILIILKFVILMPINDVQDYKMYAKRDQLALAVIKGEIDQDSKEYKLVSDVINSVLYYSKNDYNFMRILKEIVTIKEKVEEKGEKYTLGSQPLLEEIYRSSYAFFVKKMKLKIGFFVHVVLMPMAFVLRITLFVLEAILSIFELGEKILADINRMVEVLADISLDYRKSKI